ncbi:NUDIX hydrolase [Actinorugispora endophytica]|uniref:8-oxo-dGTP diphosphatase n=1 Tax=Actinorugispora endophytica TaxID=1605990 RepID=A0A4R6UHM5_9ACTN|nr:NUDIX domain-containing protein [Actinorugispora endophytica]TDQ46348.1 8-oxo-dGTP diphosphatase [Actinorugispora endophytica]
METERERREAEFLAAYDPRAFAPVAVTVDVVALTIRGGELCVLCVRRAEPPFEGEWALPGGFVREDEDLAGAALRELAEETDLPPTPHLEQLAAYGAPERDPRMRVVSVAHMVMAPDLPEPRGGGDAAEAAWRTVAEVEQGEALAFDHARITADALERARSKLEYTSLATAFLPAEFTVADLRGVYETVWGRPLHAANFHRKVLSVPGLVTDTGRLTESGGARGGRRARLYSAGPATALHPALLRPAAPEPRSGR